MDRAQLKPPGELYDVGGHRLHAVITGRASNQPAIVLETGLTAMSACWSWIQDELAKETRVLAYDRAGLGWSEASAKPKDAATIARELRELTLRAELKRPFILVGHSMGAFFARAYAAEFPEDLAALVFIDGSHPEQIERSPNVSRAMRRFFWFLKATPAMADYGVMKWANNFGLARHCDKLPPPAHDAILRAFSSPQHMRATAREASEWFTSAQQIRDRKLGALPLLVLTAPDRAMQGWMDLQKELAALSSRGRHVVIPNATHMSILTEKDHALRAAAEIKSLLSD